MHKWMVTRNGNLGKLMDMKTGNQGQVSMVFAFEKINETKVHFICFMEFNFNVIKFLYFFNPSNRYAIK